MKKQLIELVLQELSRELSGLMESANSAREAATHEESKAEDSHDTRGLEASYLAGAQMARIEAVKKVIHTFQFADFRDFKPTDAIGVGALIELESDGKKILCFLVAQGGGISIPLHGKTVQLITPQAPLGDALIGRKAGDAVEVEIQRGTREYEILSVS